jgi:hypothetical protein
MCRRSSAPSTTAAGACVFDRLLRRARPAQRHGHLAGRRGPGDHQLRKGALQPRTHRLDVGKEGIELFTVGHREARVVAALVIAGELALCIHRAGQQPKRQRGIAQHRDAMLLAQRHQGRFDLAVDQAVALLDGIDRPVAQVLLQRGRVDIAHPNGTDLPLLLQGEQRVHGLGHRRGGILPVRDVEVDVVGVQPRQAALHLVGDGLAAQVAVHRLPFLVEEMRALVRVPYQAAFGGDHRLVPPADQGFPQQFLGTPQPVGRRSVDQPHTGVQRGADGLHRSGIVPAAPHPATHGPGAQADGLALDARCAELHRLHRFAFLTFMKWSTVTAPSRIRPLITSCQ